MPLLLLPTALGVGQYEAHDVMLVMVLSFATRFEKGNNERISEQGLNPKTRLWKLMLPWEMGVSTSQLRYAVDGNVGDETT